MVVLPKSICTDMLAWDKSRPELCKALVSVSNNLREGRHDQSHQEGGSP